MQETTLYIEEMCCENEARLVKAEMHGLKGVKGCEANLISKSLKVIYDPSIISIKDILNSIGKTGMKAGFKKGEKEKKEII